MRTAPTDGEFPILVCILSEHGKNVAVPAMWGQPVYASEPGWWGCVFALASGDPMCDLPELRATLTPLTYPLGWKPWPKAKKRER